MLRGVLPYRPPFRIGVKLNDLIDAVATGVAWSGLVVIISLIFLPYRQRWAWIAWITMICVAISVAVS